MWVGWSAAASGWSIVEMVRSVPLTSSSEEDTQFRADSDIEVQTEESHLREQAEMIESFKKVAEDPRRPGAT